MEQGSKKKGHVSLIRISDVLKAGDRLSTGGDGPRRYLLPGIEVSLSSQPAGAQGGDFYGMVYMEHGRTAVFVGDISGHDFSSSIVAAQVVEYIDRHQDALAHPHLFLHKMAIAQYKKLTAVGRFFTAAVCVVDIENNILSYANAGHPPALLFRGISGDVIEVGGKSLPIGFDEIINYNQIQFDFHPGDVLLLYTDGLSSARNGEKDEFGTDRIRNLLMRWAHDPASVISRLYESLEAFTGTSTNTDDLTTVCLARTKT